MGDRSIGVHATPTDWNVGPTHVDQLSSTGRYGHRFETGGAKGKAKPLKASTAKAISVMSITPSGIAGFGSMRFFSGADGTLR